MSARKAPPKTKSGKRAPASKGKAPKAAPKQSKDRSQKAPPSGDVAPKVRENTKLSVILDMLKQDGGTTIEALSDRLGWERHSVHGLISGKLRKKMGLKIQSEKKEGVRVYSLAE